MLSEFPYNINNITEPSLCVGFENYYERMLKDLDEPAIRKLYEETFAEEDMILEAWEQKKEQVD